MSASRLLRRSGRTSRRTLTDFLDAAENRRPPAGEHRLNRRKEPPMRIDLYTRVVLTVIATCLIWLCVVLTPVGTPLRAQSNVQNVRIVGVKHPGYSKPDHLTLGPQESRLLGDWDALDVTR
jgi:hypothetical protein